MNVIAFLDSTPVTEALGWTLLHFVWQGMLLAGLAWTVLHLMRKTSAAARYMVCCAGMGLMLAAPVVTLVVIMRQDARPVTEAALELFLLDLNAMPVWAKVAPFLPWLTFFWLTGTLLFQGRVLLNWTQAQRMKRHGVSEAPGGARRMMNDLCTQLKVGRAVRLYESSLAQVPMVMGWLKPVILVPGYALTGLTAEQLKSVLAHELAHVRRHDYVVNLIQALFESLLFYHPAVWWISHRLRAEREYCCDDVAVSVCRDALCYARALSSLDTLGDEQCRPALATTGGNLMNRIFRIVGVSSTPSGRMGGWLAPLAIILSMTGAVSAMSFGSDAGQEDPGKEIVIAKMVTDNDVQGDDEKKMIEIKKKAKAIEQKMAQAGKSEKEIQKTLDAFFAEAGVKRKKTEATDDHDFDEKVKMIVKKMEAKGSSKEEIKKTIWKLKQEHEESLKLAQKKEILKKKEIELVKKMKAAGSSEKEIKIALTDFHKKHGTPPPPAKDAFVDRDELIMKMKKAGKSKEQIKKALHDMEMKEKQRIKKG